MNFLCLVFLTFLMIFGVIDLTKTILKRIMMQNKRAPIKEVKIPIYGHCENIEFIIRKIIFKYTWVIEYPNFKITVINNGADYETLRICEYLAKTITKLNITI